ncbi:MAG: tRNA lysidine(34) synthetase TilS, partial [Pseudomonadota bacterium]
VPAGSNLEARARAARYAAYGEVVGAEEALVLAHHADDRLDSRLLHLLQGRGNYWIPGERAFARGRLLRPLLTLPRSSLRAYGDSRGLRWLEDPGNADLSLDRNFLRHEILPALTARFGQLNERLGRVEQHQAGLAEALDASLGLRREPLPLAVFHGLGSSARRAVLRRSLTLKVPAAGVSDAALDEFLAQLDAANDRQPVLAVGVGTLRRFREALFFVAPAPDLEAAYACEVPGRLQLPHGELILSRADEADPGAPGQRLLLKLPLSVTFAAKLDRSPRLEVGTRTAPFRRTLKAIFADAGIPPWERGTWPLVMDGEGLAAVAGIEGRRSEIAGDGVGHLGGRGGEGTVAAVIEWRPKAPGARAGRQGTGTS